MGAEVNGDVDVDVGCAWVVPWVGIAYASKANLKRFKPVRIVGKDGARLDSRFKQ